ncbi:LytTR family transcriptional regulator DNA-binding domain-containing protein, partial [Enterobacter hormaechei]|nr:LytTR family transcriptional regulator DNA-binding domain-containing protein [Enterobacter hormaechei]
QEKDKHTQRFYSPHKSFLVNIGNIREIDRKNLEIVFYEDHRCPISRLKIRKLKDILEKKSQNPNFKLKLATQKKFTWRLVVQAFFRVVVNPIFDKSYFFRSRFLGSFR